MRAEPVQVLDGVADAYVTVGRDWRVTYASAAALGVLGSSLELVGASLWEALPSLARAPAERLLREAMDAARVTTLQATAADGRWFAARALPTGEGIVLWLLPWRDAQPGDDEPDAGDASSEALCALVAEAAAVLLGTEIAGVGRFEGDELVVLASWSRAGAPTIPVGRRVPIVADTVMAAVIERRAPAQVENAAALDRFPFPARAAAPVLVEGEIWGVVGTSSRH